MSNSAPLYVRTLLILVAASDGVLELPSAVCELFDHCPELKQPHLFALQQIPSCDLITSVESPFHSSKILFKKTDRSGSVGLRSDDVKKKIGLARWSQTLGGGI